MNPVEGEPLARVPIRAVESSRDYFGITGPAWHEGTLVVPLSHSVTAFDADAQTPLWSWTNGPDWDAARVVIARPADVYVLNAQISDLQAEDDVGAAELVRLSIETGDVLQRIPLPFFATRGDGRWGADIVPLDDGTALVVSGEGNVAVLGTADETLLPLVEVGSSYPALGSTVTVRVSAPVDGARFIVSWAEGAPANATQGETLEHRYVTAGARVLRVTSVYPDGRTATREVPLFVGAPEPPSNFVAKAFAPESQNVTFGVLGLAATAVGAVVALVIRRRRRSVLDAELRRLEEIREKAAHDPAAGSRALCALRRRLRADLASGRLDDAQFSLLENRLSGLLRGARRRLLVPFVPHMSRAYRMLVESALEDGHVTPAEARHLVLALDVETGMGQEVKDGLRALFEGWNAEEEAAMAAAG